MFTPMPRKTVVSNHPAHSRMDLVEPMIIGLFFYRKSKGWDMSRVELCVGYDDEGCCVGIPVSP